MSAAVTLAPVLDAALRARDAGISVMPIAEDGSKAPAVGTWKRHMRSIPSEEEIRYRFATSTGLAFVCGKVSGGLECLDFDKRDAFDAFVELARASGHGELLERVMAGYHERSPRGVHLLYRCSAPRSTKLAKRREEGGTKAKAIIETKGEGGYVIVAPSHGGVHPDGVYELVSGSIETIVSLADEERAALHEIARALDEGLPTAPAHVEPELEPLPSGAERPGDEWARMTSWAEILEPHGWVRLWTRGPITYWRRPGKSQGISATTNYAESDLLYVFSTSTDFEANRGYGKFGAYALLEHRGDYRAASRCLRDQGYGQPYRSTIEGVDLSALTAKPKAKANPSKAGGFPEHLFDVPGLVGELHRYIVESAVAPQPILALGAAICAVGTLAGRRVQGSTGLLTNVYVVALGESGSGKEHPITAVRRVFAKANLGRLASTENVTGDAAINGAVEANPSCLMMFDEFGHFIQESREKQNGVIRSLLRLFGVGVAPYYGKTYAVDRRSGRQGDDYCVWAPCASVYGTTVPGRFWESLTTNDVADGFLARFLAFESDDPDPIEQNVTVDQQQPSRALVAAVEAWHPMRDLSYQAALASGTLPDVRVAGFSAGASEVLAAFTATMRSRREGMRGGPTEPFVPLFKRARVFAMKLALIRAAGRAGPDVAEVDEADMAWGAELAQWCADLIVRRAVAEIGDTEHDVRCKQVLAWLESRGGFAQKREITRRFQRFGPGLRDVLATLLDSEQVKLVKGESSGGRRPDVYMLASVTSGNFRHEGEVTDVP